MAEYYLYVSKNKVDIFFPQIKQSKFKGRLAAEIGVSIPGFSAKLSAETEFAGSEEEFSRFAAVKTFLENTEPIGTIDEPDRWIQGIADVKIVYPGVNREVVFLSADLNLARPRRKCCSPLAAQART